MIRPVWSQSGNLKTTLVLCGQLQVSLNMYLSFPELRFVLWISQPLNIAQSWFCIQNLHMDLSFQKKKRFRNLFIGFGDIKETNILTFFLKHPVYVINYIQGDTGYPKKFIKDLCVKNGPSSLHVPRINMDQKQPPFKRRRGELIFLGGWRGSIFWSKLIWSTRSEIRQIRRFYRNAASDILHFDY